MQSRIGLILLVAAAMNSAAALGAENPPTLSGTTPLLEERPLDVRMIEGLTRFSLRELERSRDERARQWQLDFSSDSSFSKSTAANRERFRQLIGVVDQRTTAADGDQSTFEVITPAGRGNASSLFARCGEVEASKVRWPVVAGVTGEGLLLKPRAISAAVVLIPDADWTPEVLSGIVDSVSNRHAATFTIARRLAAAGCLVLVPTLLGRDCAASGHPRVGYTNEPHREFLYRQAFTAGRHVIGYEVQKVLASVDLLQRFEDREIPLGVAGIGEGGLLAFYAAALDERIDAALVCGYFGPRERVWDEPLYRNVWRLLTEFGDAELARLIAPRRLVIEACATVEIDGPPPAAGTQRASGAPGRIRSRTLNEVREEWRRASDVYRQLKRSDHLVLAISGEHGDGPAGSQDALTALADGLELPTARRGAIKTTSVDKWTLDPGSETHLQTKTPISGAAEAKRREQRQLAELQAHVQALLRRSPEVRDQRWRVSAAADASRTLSDWVRKRPTLRKSVHEDLIGHIDRPRAALHAKSRLTVDRERWSAYEIELPVFDEVLAGGVLLIPKGLKDGERRPVVVCQHGLESFAADTFSHDPAAFKYYKAFAEKLAERGFVVYAPQNPYRGGDKFRQLQRMANPLGRTLFSYIVAQHEQTLDWLTTLPMVDARRIGFYGLSYGGKTAMRVPPLVERYRLAICSGDFTNWESTIAADDKSYSYIFTNEYEIPEWNLAHTAGYAELATLMAPRPFLVEQGYRDSGQPIESVWSEFGRVRRHYDLLGLSSRAELALFDGPHTIDGERAFKLLDRMAAGEFDDTVTLPK